jgi:hypothetical protein
VDSGKGGADHAQEQFDALSTRRHARRKTVINCISSNYLIQGRQLALINDLLNQTQGQRFVLFS